jgi:hypothetical protein
MSGISYASHSDHLVRANLWSNQLKEVLLDELMGTKYVDMITDFPDGDTLNIPSIGQAEVMDYAEGQGVKYTGMDTGNFTFTINKYKSSATYITEKMKQDAFYTSRLVSSFVPKQSRAIMKAMEIDIMALGPDGQTASNLNAINGANHRWVGSGTSEVINIDDFALAKYALQKANVPMTNLVAIVDPSVEFALNKIVGTSTAISYNPKWEGIVKTGMSTGMRFVTNVMGFDVYMSQNLKSGIAETINGKSVTTGVANMFFSATPDVLPFVGSIRQAPKVDSEYNKDFQREEYVTTCRYGFKLFRPENMVVVLTDTDQVV